MEKPNYLSISNKGSIRALLTSHATDNRQLYANPLSLSSTTKAGTRRCWRMPVIFGTKDTHMTTGTVKFFNADKGYGFIAPNDGGQDAFVHISAVERAGMHTLQKDQSVSYELETDQRGKTSAVNLQAAIISTPVMSPATWVRDGGKNSHMLARALDLQARAPRAGPATIYETHPPAIVIPSGARAIPFGSASALWVPASCIPPS